MKTGWRRSKRLKLFKNRTRVGLFLKHHLACLLKEVRTSSLGQTEALAHSRRFQLGKVTVATPVKLSHAVYSDNAERLTAQDS